MSELERRHKAPRQQALSIVKTRQFISLPERQEPPESTDGSSTMSGRSERGIMAGTRLLLTPGHCRYDFFCVHGRSDF
jgi:hypothetical protein